MLNTYLGDDSSPSDRLVITGSATGQSLLGIVNAGGPGAPTTGDGILVVDAVTGATTMADSFRLGGRVAEGSYEYSLYRGGETNGDSWYLRSTQEIMGVEVPNYWSRCR